MTQHFPDFRGCLRFARAGCVAVLAILCVATLAVQAENTASPDTADRTTFLTAQRQKLAARIAELSAISATSRSTEGEPAAVAVAAELKLVRDLDLVYLYHLETIELTVGAERDRRRFQEELETLQATKPTVGQTWSWLILEDYRDRLDAEESRDRSSTAEVDRAQTALENSLAESERAERNRRRVLDDAETSSASEAADHEYQQRLVTLELTVATATVDLRRAELKLKKAQQEASEKQTAWLELKLDRIRPQVVYSEADLETRKKALAAYAAELQTQLEEAQQHLRRVDGWISSRSTSSPAVAERAVAPAEKETSPGWSLGTLEFLRRLAHEEVIEVERRRVEFEPYLSSPLQRFKLVNQLATKDELTTWAEMCDESSERLEDEESRLSLRAGELLQDLATLHREARLKIDGDAVTAAEQAAREAHLERLLRTVEFSQRHALALRRGVERFLEDIQGQTGEEDVTSWLSEIPALANDVWTYELVSVGDSPITIGKLSKGLAGFLAGLVIAALVSRVLGRRILPRVGLNHGASEAIRSLSFYAICLLFGLLALELAHVPLTAFTFLGGAAAIGVGFGCQNILNNFISGLILLAEQPIRVGDLIQLGELHGTVERIGTRSTVVRTGCNVDIIVPNSKLLEDNVTNVTRSDNRYRTVVKVGVAYGSPVSEVKRQLLRAATHAQVLEQPEPFVLFADFADNSLNFELHFWVSISSLTECRRIESDVREAIDHAFTESQISMAFPQRDLHLDSARPLEIRLLDQQAQPAVSPYRKAA